MGRAYEFSKAWHTLNLQARHALLAISFSSSAVTCSLFSPDTPTALSWPIAASAGGESIGPARLAADMQRFRNALCISPYLAINRGATPSASRTRMGNPGFAFLRSTAGRGRPLSARTRHDTIACYPQKPRSAGYGASAAQETTGSRALQGRQGTQRDAPYMVFTKSLTPSDAGEDWHK